MKIKLIAPARKPEWGESFWDLKTLCKLTHRTAGGAPLALPTLAALTPSDIEVVLTDENVEPINFDEKVDLVGITGMTCVIPRSYEIADEFRKRGVPVIIGGIHASMLPEEATQHCDSVVIGEAEEIWGQVVKEAQNGSLQKFYRAPRFPDLTNSPIPRWDLLKNDAYCYFTIQTGRGCPYDCDFCSVKEFNGRQYRHKSIEQVIKEAESLLRIDYRKLMFFTDDNLLAVPSYAEELINRLIPLKIKAWWCQSSINRLNDDKILDLMHRAGCKVVFVGIESISQESLSVMNKSLINKVGEYKEAIEKVHSHKIAVFGSFVLGSDNDDESIFDNTERFINETNIAFSMINIITPILGSNLNRRLTAENRITCKNWGKYNGESICYSPKHIPVEKLEESYRLLLQKIYAYEPLYKRLSAVWANKVLTKSKHKLIDLFTMGRILFTLKTILMNDSNQRDFVLKCLWNKNVPSITNSILIALSLHDFAYQFKD